ncbi:MAG TPA: cation:proton antiporter [Solirubrobacteraceae bacterium]|nr:cation:proton antiporter [Solirubrobacteraceae bacterium]
MTIAPLAASTSFDVPLLVFGAVLMGGALLSGLAHRSFLSLTALFVLTGFLLGEGATGVLHIDPGSGFVAVLATVALVVILFRDGLEVEAEMLQREWRLPFRKLVVAMPITAGIVAVTAHLVVGLSWTESFLLGALLAPTDPVLSSSVVTNPRVPRVIRHSLNLESGLNDGLALPAVLAFAALLRQGEQDFTWWQFVLQDVTLGFAYGIALGFLAALALPRSRGLTAGIPDHQKSLYALGTAFATYGIAVLLPLEGNGLIAVFVCAITLGIRRADLRVTFEARADDIVEIAKLGVFVVFGSLLTLDGLFADGWAAVAVMGVTLLVARPVAVWIALLGTRLRVDVIAFMAWFGPKGVATMTFSLLVLADDIAANAQLFNLAALVVFTSILVHGLSDTPGAEWIADRVGPDGEVTRARAAAPAPPR